MLDSKVSITTIITVFSYLAYMFYRLGESIFFGYPISLIWTDLNTLILALLQNSMIILALCIIFRMNINRNNSIISNMIMPIIGILAILIYLCKYNYFIDIYQIALLIIVIFFLAFVLLSIIEKIIKKPALGMSINFISLIFLVVYGCLTFMIGNYFASSKSLMIDSENSIIVADYKDKVVKIKCNDNGERQLIVSALDDKELKTISNDYFKRDWLIGKCIKKNKLERVNPLVV